MRLKTKPHPHPYKLKWLDDKASGAVSKQCLVSFMIGSYKDQVWCDVLDMSACHLLLGRPWQYDRKTTHDGFANTYTVRHEEKLKDLIPLPPPPAQNLQLMNRKACEREIKSQEEVYLMFSKEIDQPVDLPERLSLYCMSMQMCSLLSYHLDYHLLGAWNTKLI